MWDWCCQDAGKQGVTCTRGDKRLRPVIVVGIIAHVRAIVLFPVYLSSSTGAFGALGLGGLHLNALVGEVGGKASCHKAVLGIGVSQGNAGHGWWHGTVVDGSRGVVGEVLGPSADRDGRGVGSTDLRWGAPAGILEGGDVEGGGVDGDEAFPDAVLHAL